MRNSFLAIISMIFSTIGLTALADSVDPINFEKIDRISLSDDSANEDRWGR